MEKLMINAQLSIIKGLFKNKFSKKDRIKSTLNISLDSNKLNLKKKEEVHTLKVLNRSQQKI